MYAGAVSDCPRHSNTNKRADIEHITPATRQGFLNIKIPQVRRQFSKRKERRRQYAVTRQEYQRDRLRCIRNILDGTTEARQPRREVMEPYWTYVRTHNSKVAPEFKKAEQNLNDLWIPITPEEVRRNKVEKKTAPGPDGLTGRDYASMPVGLLVCLFDLILWTEKLPNSLMASRTIFIPKKGFEDQPERYRPITIPPVLVRGLHRILAAWLKRAITIDPRQTGFRSHIDGCKDNTFQLDFILKQSSVDDVNMYATTPRGLEALLNKMEEFLTQCGLSINIDKSFTLGFRPSPKDKISTIHVGRKFKVGERSLRRITRNDA